MILICLNSARTSTPAITHCTVPTTSTPPPASTNTSTPAAAEIAPPASAPNAPKKKSRAEQSARTSGAATASPATAETPATASSTTSNPIQLSDLQNFLQGISTAPPEQQSGNLLYFLFLYLKLYF